MILNMGNEPWDEYANYLNGTTVDPEEENESIGVRPVEVADEPEPVSSSPASDASSSEKRAGSSKKKGVSRQKIKSDVSDRLIAFKISENELFYLRNLAFLNGTNMSALLRSLVADYIDKNKGLLKERVLEK